MANLVVDSLFTKVLLDKTIDIYLDDLYNGKKNPLNILKHDFEDLLNITAKQSLFMFNNKYCKQVDDVAMGYLLGPTLVNIFKCIFESKQL